MSEKVKLSRYLAESITQVRNEYKAGSEYDLELMKNEKRASTNVIYNYTQQSRENLARYFQALVIGYEVEATPEEKIWDFYHTKASCDMHPHDAIKHVLNFLNIKIDGVNK